MPTMHKVVDLRAVQVLQHEVLKLGGAQPLGLIANYARCYQYGNMCKIAAKSLDIIEHHCSCLAVKYFVQAIQHQYATARRF